LTTGNPDLVGERKRRLFAWTPDKTWLDETFEIKLRNRQKRRWTMRVVEHIYPLETNWNVTAKVRRVHEEDAQDNRVQRAGEAG